MKSNKSSKPHRTRRRRSLTQENQKQNQYDNDKIQSQNQMASIQAQIQSQILNQMQPLEYTPDQSASITALRRRHFFNPNSDNDSLWITETIRVRSSYLPHNLVQDINLKGIPPLRLQTILTWLGFHATGQMEVQCISNVVELLRFTELGEFHIQYRYYDEEKIMSRHIQEWITDLIIRLCKKQIASSIPLAMRLSWLLEWYGVQNPMFRDGGPLLSFLMDEAWHNWSWSVIFAPKKLMKNVLLSHHNPFTNEDLILRAVIIWCLVRTYLEKQLDGEIILTDSIDPKVGEFAVYILSLTPLAMVEKSIYQFPLYSTSKNLYIQYEGSKQIEMSLQTVKDYFMSQFAHLIFFEQLEKGQFMSLQQEIHFFTKEESIEICAAIDIYRKSRELNLDIEFHLFGKTYTDTRRRLVSNDELKPKVNQHYVDRLYNISPEMVSYHSLFLPEFTLGEQRWSLCLRETKTHLAIFLYNQNMFQGLPPRIHHKILKLRVRISLIHRSNPLLNRCLSFDQEWKDTAYGFEEFVPMNGIWDGDYCDASGCIVLALRVELI